MRNDTMESFGISSDILHESEIYKFISEDLLRCHLGFYVCLKVTTSSDEHKLRHGDPQYGMETGYGDYKSRFYNAVHDS